MWLKNMELADKNKIKWLLTVTQKLSKLNKMDCLIVIIN